MDELPIVRGAAGLTGRPRIDRPAEELDQPEEDPVTGEPVWPRRGTALAIPSTCLRVLTVPRAPCPGVECPGQQRDGGCLCDIVRAAQTAGVEWRFEVDPNDGYWDYAGEPVPGLTVTRSDFGRVETAWDPGAGPSAAEAVTEPPPSFDCPHCGEHVEQTPENFHWWCPACGKNAHDGA